MSEFSGGAPPPLKRDPKYNWPGKFLISTTVARPLTIFSNGVSAFPLLLLLQLLHNFFFGFLYSVISEKTAFPSDPQGNLL